MSSTATWVRRNGLRLICAAVLAAVASRADAQTVVPSAPSASAAAIPPMTPADLSWLRAQVGDAPARVQAMRAAGVAQTSVDHRFADRLVGQIGFLCGLHSGVGDDDGAAAMRGADSEGRFLGAKLSFAFK